MPAYLAKAFQGHALTGGIFTGFPDGVPLEPLYGESLFHHPPPALGHDWKDLGGGPKYFTVSSSKIDSLLEGSLPLEGYACAVKIFRESTDGDAGTLLDPEYSRCLYRESGLFEDRVIGSIERGAVEKGDSEFKEDASEPLARRCLNLDPSEY